MGGYYSSVVEPAETRRVADVKRLAGFDCKSYARTLAHEDKGLVVKRGYAVMPSGFTEHWWCVNRTGNVVDVTDLRDASGAIPDYVALPGAIGVSTCDAMTGPCHENPACAWCRARAKLEDRGLARVRVPISGTRIVLDVLMRRNNELRRHLYDLALKREGEVVRCRVCGSVAEYDSDLFWKQVWKQERLKERLRGFEVQHTEDCPLA